VDLVQFLRSREQSIVLDGLQLRPIAAPAAAAALVHEPIDVLDIDLDFFYDPRRDQVRRSALTAFEAAVRDLKAPTLSVAASVSEGYCPRRLAAHAIGQRRAVCARAVSRRLRRLADASAGGRLSQPSERCRLTLRYRAGVGAARCACGARRSRLPCALVRALALASRGDYAGALAMFARLRSRYREDWRIRYALGVCALALDDRRLLAGLVAGCGPLDAQIAQLLHLRAAWLAREGRGRAAYQVARHAAELAPCWTAPQQLIVSVASERRWHTEARAARRHLRLLAELRASTIMAEL
jgi:hypothetical protein